MNLNTVALRGKYPARRKKGGPKQYKGRDGDKRGPAPTFLTALFEDT